MRTIEFAIPELPASAPVTRFTFEFLTPLFGGGVSTREPDPVTPVRGSAIRGHLRFWWRQLYANGLSAEEMRSRESAVFGHTKAASPFRIAVSGWSGGTLVPCGSWGRTARGYPVFNLTVGPSYAIFPFRPQYETDPIPQVWQGLKFDLEVEVPKNPELKQELLLSLHAWANFGGLGSRTRRGCGALYCEKLALSTPRARSIVLPYPRPPLFQVYLAPGSPKAWDSVVSVFQRFRQDPVGRNGMSRSFWPAADSLRAIAGMGQPDHMDSLTLNDPATTPHFPGAEFGLPIVYHFKSSKPSPSRAEFDDGSVSGTLYPADETSKSMHRMSSSLILRPLKTKDGITYPCIVRLPWTPPQFLRYKFDMKALVDWTGPYSTLRPDWFQPKAELVPDITGFHSAIDAFLRYAGDGSDNRVASFEKVYPKP